MEKVLNLYKPRGQTPLETLEALKAARPEYAKENLTYAGRLDPMAEGVLLALVGDETKNREAYTGLDKEYIFEFIFGLATDTYDLLGLVKNPSQSSFDFLRNAKEYLEKQKGKFMQKYPPFSSKVVDGKNLFTLAKGGRLKEKDLPSHEVEIKEIEYLGHQEIQKNILAEFVKNTVSSVNGDFRQKQVLTDWHNHFSKSDREMYIVHKARVVSSSGFYVRQFVSDIGKAFNTGAVTFSILRTKVGVYNIEKSLCLH